MKKIQLGLIFGGRSCEHEVSVISAIQLSHSVDRAKYDLYPIYINKNGEWFTGKGLLDLQNYKEPIMFSEKGKFERVFLDVTANSGALVGIENASWLYGRKKLKLIARLDCTITVLHGLHGEDGSVQGMLELANIPYTSSGVMGASAAMDKIIMKKLFREDGIPVLDDCYILRSEYLKDKEKNLSYIESKLKYPMFVKPANLGSSIGVSRADDREKLEQAINLAIEFDRRILIEQGLDKPTELNCSCIGFDDEVEASILEMPVSDGEMLTYAGKYLNNNNRDGMASLGRIIPAPVSEALSDRIRELSKKVFRLLDCKGVVRIDWMQDKKTNEIYITEINTIPGSLSFYIWKECRPRLSYPKLIDKLVFYAQRAHSEKNRNNYSFTSSIFDKMQLDGSKGTKA